ncbi:hypothetical protein KV112_10220 [Mycolicibacter sp. MYC123]|uniref:Uncharacterized protein n=1 Tax=[Mycobacterium] zoologicum TaxID=2872311 RepID=A0ABU5YJ83_9MYCO|nr:MULTISPECIES: hypothetical protein [unclassified Mycolicibacter]MEB3050105.1 hypothetical protein [Mycolicibacter sp. MYC123]MEB3065341.1 hypothetical protein [Mycolicibacter sp. MYC101]
MTESRYASLTRDELAVLVPELLLIGHMIDRSGMAWCISEFGREEMLQIAIEEWAGASPVYAQRMQRALNFVGDDVPTIFKGIQFDIGSPPQFMDFRFTVHDRWNGEFELASCGALLDVEPMGEDYVFGMCHTIEDPTFDATAVATNVKAQCRPVHRPPRTPSDREPHCCWTVIIDESYPPAQPIPALAVISQTRAAAWELDDIDPSDEGLADYTGPLLADVDFTAFSHSALVRLADEVCLQMHLLYLSFALAVRARCGDSGEGAELATSVGRRQLTGLAGLAAMRIKNAMRLSDDIDGALRTFELHPLLNPAGYVQADITGGVLSVRRSPAHDDGAWIALCSPESINPLQAIATAVNPYLRVAVEGDGTDWSLELSETDTAATELPEVMVTKVSGGAKFVFRTRKSLPLTVV